MDITSHSLNITAVDFIMIHSIHYEPTLFPNILDHPCRIRLNGLGNRRGNQIMELLFKRGQSSGSMTRVNFGLWGKLDMDEDELALISRYRLDEAVLISSDDSELLRKAIKLGVVVFVFTALLFMFMFGFAVGFLGGIAFGVGAGYWLMNENRETIFVRDLLHGRNFTCDSVVELAKKEAWLEGACSVLRQVMESAKHWDGVERHTIEPLPKDQAKDLIVRIA